MAAAFRAEPGAQAASPAASEDIDLAALIAGIWRRRLWVIGPTLFALAAATAFVFLATPLYKATTDILIENRDTGFAAGGADAGAPPAREIDEQLVQSQTPLILSRDAAREVIERLGLNQRSEFDPAMKGGGPIDRLFILLGLAAPPTASSPDDRVLRAFYDRVDAFPQRGSRVLTIEATSEDPQVAADIANELAAEYLRREARAKQETAVQAGGFLLGEIGTLRARVTEAEAAVERFRSESGLLQGANATTITTIQLSDLNARLSSARARQADLNARARLIREALENGRIFDVSEINNNELVRRLLEQRSTLTAQLALEERIYLPQHPRIKELTAQIRDLETQIRNAAERAARGLENDAKAAQSRVEAIEQEIAAQKTVVARANGDEVQLRELEREAKALRDQLETFLARYNDAQARDRDNAVTPDARVVSRAIPPSTPSFPRKGPTIAIATLGTLFMALILVASGQLLGAATLRRAAPAPAPAEPHAPAPLDVIEATLAPIRAGASAAQTPPRPGDGRDRFGLAPEARLVLEPEAAYARAVRAVADKLKALRGQGRAACIVVVGSEARAGATSAAIGLARTLAKDGRTIAIDLNPPRPGLARMVAAVRPTGLTNVLAGENPFGEAIHRDRASRCHVLPLGDAAVDVLRSDLLTVALDALSQTYDFMVVDAGLAPRQRPELVRGADLTLIVSPGREGDAGATAAQLAMRRHGAREIMLIAAEEAPAPTGRGGVSPPMAFAAAG
jgi:uncharacterized protein involved in exopolysaccharide biosynthesis/Mrp family chromosome partitioning ATPase